MLEQISAVSWLGALLLGSAEIPQDNYWIDNPKWSLNNCLVAAASSQCEVFIDQRALFEAEGLELRRVLCSRTNSEEFSLI